MVAPSLPYCSPQPFCRPKDVVANIGTAAVGLLGLGLLGFGVLADWDDGMFSAHGGSNAIELAVVHGHVGIANLLVSNTSPEPKAASIRLVT